jgi:hypothetical protein
MADGKGCTCNAMGAFECACDADWTPQELIDARKQIEELKAYQEKLLCENEIHEQCIANIIDTKPGGSIEGQMIAATQACVRAEQRNEELEAELAALKKDVGFLCSRICYSSDFRTPQDVYEAAQRILDATNEDTAFARGDMLQAPCFKCGYNGEGYFQPDTHACAEKHHTLWKEKP